MENYNINRTWKDERKEGIVSLKSSCILSSLFVLLSFRSFIVSFLLRIFINKRIGGGGGGGLKQQTMNR